MSCRGRVLIVAGSDPSGGAGIQADIKTVTALGGYAAAAVTALTVQNTRGVTAVMQAPSDIINGQIRAVLDDIGADAIKIGMLGDLTAAEAVEEALKSVARDIPIVLDPVLIATSGHSLAQKGVAEFLVRRLAPLAAVVTPNADEAASLTGFPVSGPADLARAGRDLLRAGAAAALVKGGHLTGEDVVDVLVDPAGEILFRNPRIASTSTHGTGCTLSSAIATGLAQGMALRPAVARAIDYVREAIRTAPGLGSGAGPLNHAHPVTEAKK
ncbi:MAG: bifunctional hydroxymethylpyrimidine kinase/phosphomethylpyrimidine kinase [Parvularculaceae bacterium]|nr:bifunctional hydroxymethylpyrimidine kinase/phosphomethylpyrimidine kinase [Parvularculaceae bacterium]